MKKLYFIALAAITLSACTNEEDILVNPAAPQEISFKTVNYTLSRNTPAEGTVFDTNNKFYAAAYYTNAAGDKSNYFSDVEFANETGITWSQTATNKYFYPLEGSMNFLAYSFDKTKYSSVVPDWSKTTIGTEQHIDAKSVTLPFGAALNGWEDVMHGATTGVPCGKGTQSSDAAIKFEHALCWVRFYVEAGNSTTDEQITIQDITVNKPVLSGTFTATGDNTTSSWVEADKVTATSPLSIRNLYDTNHTSAMGALKIKYNDPKEFGNGFLAVDEKNKAGDKETTFTITYDLKSGGKTYEGLKYTTAAIEDDWAPGQMFSYYISITLNEIKINATQSNFNTTETAHENNSLTF